MEIRRLVVSSTQTSAETVLSFMEGLAREKAWSEDLTDRILLASSEAATNAMDHGNGFDPLKDVVIEVHLNESAVLITVEDEGVGFTRSTVADPMAEENLLHDNGRGLFIIEQLADGVEYELGGRKLCLRFNHG